VPSGLPDIKDLALWNSQVLENRGIDDGKVGVVLPVARGKASAIKARVSLAES